MPLTQLRAGFLAFAGTVAVKAFSSAGSCFSGYARHKVWHTLNFLPHRHYTLLTSLADSFIKISQTAFHHL